MDSWWRGLVWRPVSASSFHLTVWSVGHCHEPIPFGQLFGNLDLGAGQSQGPQEAPRGCPLSHGAGTTSYGSLFQVAGLLARLGNPCWVMEQACGFRPRRCGLEVLSPVAHCVPFGHETLATHRLAPWPAQLGTLQKPSRLEVLESGRQASCAGCPSAALQTSPAFARRS